MPAKFIPWRATIVVAITLSAGIGPALAWDEDGHVIITSLAISKLPQTMPEWLRTENVASRLHYLSAEPDRWRGQHSPVVDHWNNPDHYIDGELLQAFNLSLKTLPPLRRQFTDAMATERALHPEKFKPYDPTEDASYTRLSPGMLPYRIAELQWKIAADWTTLKTYEKHRDLVTDEMIRNARENVIYDMGIISHFVGDGSQPLHLTEHHHGWVGDNPKGYTREHEIHQYIDGGILAAHKITRESLVAQARPPRKMSKDDCWQVTLEYLDQTFREVEPLYILEKSGDLKKEPGKKFIGDRLLEGGAMLSGVWVAAFENARIDEFRENQLMGRRARPPTSQPVENTPEPAAKAQ